MSAPQPILRSARLTLRPFRADDAATVSLLIDDPEIARNTLTIPHPYPEGEAERWIARHVTGWDEGRRATFAVILDEGDVLCGAAGLEIERNHARAELGYWIARAHWNRGLASEAARTLIEFAFTQLDLQRVFASHFNWNPASGRVLERCGMQREGLLRGHVQKLGQPIDNVIYGILRGDPTKPSAPDETGA